MTRRQLLALAPVCLIPLPAHGQTANHLPANFPSQDPEKVRQVVGASHANFAKVKELVTAQPALAKAVWDWGYGDWESALGAASHTGQKEIAEFLVANGARPDVFFFAMMNKLEAVRACIAVEPRLATTHGPHGISLMAHAEAGEAKDVVEYLKTVPGTELGQTSLAITEAEKEIYMGRYTFGPGANDYLEVFKNSRAMLVFRRGEAGNPHRLLRVGDNDFAPAGALEVRVRFTVVDGKATSLSVHDVVELVVGKRA